ncbi:heme/hemin ABC transporter substrate-binding protein [Boudabousia liubingyangii]|uniref:heme/hemin ABC transporter substrate-binding protein n=1 Tax=Boudabousia liubingyangii TaxID=1921764 RepID=UPI0009FA29D2|nr:ABC transporter substrate-binding protein [Boudabousia liubingyangii]
MRTKHFNTPSSTQGKRYRRTLLALALAGSLSLSACGVGAKNSQGEAAPTSSQSTSVGSAQTPANGTAEAGGKSGEAASAQNDGTPAPDPRALTGVSEVPELPDPTPIAGNYPQKLPVTLKDFNGNDITIKDTSRILALDIYGTLSRTVISLGYGKNLVGRTISSVEKQLADLPIVTQNGHNLNVEAVLNLKPTLIIADRTIGPPEAIQQLAAAGIPVYMVDPVRHLETNGQLIKTVAQVLGVPAAGEALAQRTDQEVAAAKAKIANWAPKEPMRGAFLYVRGKAGIFFILGSEDGATELLQGVSAKDVAGENGIKTVSPANPEALVKLNPEVIFVMKDGLHSTGDLDGFMSRPGVKQTIAGQKTRLISIPDGISLSFGPQSGQVLELVARALYGVK